MLVTLDIEIYSDFYCRLNRNLAQLSQPDTVMSRVLIELEKELGFFTSVNDVSDIKNH